MTNEQIFKRLDEMLANPKSRNFLNHLVKAYFPIGKANRVIETPENNFKCVLTNEKLVSMNDALTIIVSDEFKTSFVDSLKVMFDESHEKKTVFKNFLGDKKLGLVGHETTTYMSYDAYLCFYDWLATKTLTGDKHINWLMSSIRFKDRGGDKKATSNKNQKIVPTTFSLGEVNGALANLKKQLENEA